MTNALRVERDRDGDWALLDGGRLIAHFGSEGAARAGLEVETRRRAPAPPADPPITVEITDTAWILLGLDDRRVVADYQDKGITIQDRRATGQIEDMWALRAHAEAFVAHGGAEDAGTRASARALIRRIDAAVSAAGFEWA